MWITKAQYCLHLVEAMKTTRGHTGTALGIGAAAAIPAVGYLAHTHGSEIADKAASVAGTLAYHAEKHGVTSKIPGIIKTVAEAPALQTYKELVKHYVRHHIRAKTGY